MENSRNSSILCNKNGRKSYAVINIIVFLFFSIVMVLILSTIIERIIHAYIIIGQEETWVSSIASYWGGIIGGIVSGVFAFLGVFYTIRYYKDSDEKKERASIQPFLLVRTGQDKYQISQVGFTLGKSPIQERKEIRISIQNIGNGFASTVAIHTGFNSDGFEYNEVIPINDYTYTYFIADKSRLVEGLPFEIYYIDSMTNKYIQEYKIKSEYGSIKIECGYPQLLR